MKTRARARDEERQRAGKRKPAARSKGRRVVFAKARRSVTPSHSPGCSPKHPGERARLRQDRNRLDAREPRGGRERGRPLVPQLPLGFPASRRRPSRAHTLASPEETRTLLLGCSVAPRTRGSPVDEQTRRSTQRKDGRAAEAEGEESSARRDDVLVPPCLGSCLPPAPRLPHTSRSAPPLLAFLVAKASGLGEAGPKVSGPPSFDGISVPNQPSNRPSKRGRVSVLASSLSRHRVACGLSSVVERETGGGYEPGSGGSVEVPVEALAPAGLLALGALSDPVVETDDKGEVLAGSSTGLRTAGTQAAGWYRRGEARARRREEERASAFSSRGRC